MIMMTCPNANLQSQITLVSGHSHHLFAMPLAIISCNVHISEKLSISNKQEMMRVNGIRPTNCILYGKADQHAVQAAYGLPGSIYTPWSPE
jgi:hypothetical protein